MRLVLITNILTPYRKVFYDELFRQCKEKGDEFHVIVMAETEPGRHWNYKDFQTEYTSLLTGKIINISKIYTIINFGLKKKLMEIKPDIVIASGSYMITTVWRAIMLSKKLGYKTFYWNESHDDEERHYSKIKFIIREVIRKSVLRQFDGFWYAGKKSKELIQKYGKDNAHYIFVPNLVDTNKFSRKITNQQKADLLKKYNIDETKKILICPARLHPAKGILEFLDLFSKCKGKDACTILLAGDGELADVIQTKIHDLQLDVRMLGYKSEEEMIQMYAIADIFLLPSKSDPNPLSCIEACWRGLPLLVSEHVGNHPELVCEGVNGFVFDYNAMKKSIEKIDNMIFLGETWYRNASLYSYQLAQKRYNPVDEVERILKEHHFFLGV